MGKLVILVGAPGSGKSTFAEKFKDRIGSKYCSIVSRDKIRFSYLKEEDTYFAYEKEVKRDFYNKIRSDLKRYNIVLADATHLTRRSRQELIKIGQEFNGVVEAIVFEPSLKKCLMNNNKREGREKVPRSVVKRMFFSFERPTKEEGFSFIEDAKDFKGVYNV